jgi:HPr kinase/phosphorylase
MTTIIEVAARNHLLKLQGHHSAQEFAQRLSAKIARSRFEGDRDNEVSAITQSDGEVE